MKTFIPGPWTAKANEDKFDITFKLMNGHSRTLASVPGKDNANLIAAAPEMFELLKAISKFSHDQGSEGVLKFCETFKTDDTIYGSCIGERILEVLAKATGK